MKILICVVIAWSLCGDVLAQWTIPDTTRCPQPGTGAESPWISNDNLHLYMSSMAEVSVFSRVSVDSAWGPRTDIPRINITNTQRCPAVSPNNDTLYFIGDPRPDCDTNYGSWDVYYTIRTGPCDTCWGPVHNAGPNVNSDRREYSVGISRDGSILLVASNRNGYIDPQLYWHEKQSDGTWGPANIYPREINDISSGAGHEHPCLSPDNNRLFFWHTRVMMGDIYVSEKVNGIWQQAVPLPSPPNNYPQVSCDADPCMATDGRTLWIRESPYPCEAYRIAVTIDTSVLAASPRTQPLPQTFALSCSPNPFNPSTQISFALPQTTHVELQIYNMLGQRVTTLVDEVQLAGSHRVTWDERNAASGLYVCRIEAGRFTDTKKLLLIR